MRMSSGEVGDVGWSCASVSILVGGLILVIVFGNRWVLGSDYRFEVRIE